MATVKGIGGVFFKAKDPDAMYEWYERHLGIKREGPVAIFRWKDQEGKPAITVWSQFPRDTKYFKDSKSPVMMNYRVDDLDAALATLAEGGVEVDPDREDSEYGKFGWITDLEGNRIELWEPPEKFPGE